jgi:hypothetical protein
MLVGAVLPAALLGLASCLSAGGPCVHEYHDPALVIETVGNPRPPVVNLHGILIDGRDPGGLAPLLSGPSFGATAVGDTIRCVGRCGFGTTEGRFSFTATAAGFRPQQVEVNVRYRDLDGGCPSSNAGSTEYRLGLSPGP